MKITASLVALLLAASLFAQDPFITMSPQGLDDMARINMVNHSNETITFLVDNDDMGKAGPEGSVIVYVQPGTHVFSAALPDGTVVVKRTEEAAAGQEYTFSVYGPGSESDVLRGQPPPPPPPPWVT